MAEWFYQRNGQKLGPLDTAALKRMAIAGELDPSDLIWREGMAQWAKASQAKGLFPTPVPIAAPPAHYEVEATRSAPQARSVRQWQEAEIRPDALAQLATARLPSVPTTTAARTTARKSMGPAAWAGIGAAAIGLVAIAIILPLAMRSNAGASAKPPPPANATPTAIPNTDANAPANAPAAVMSAPVAPQIRIHGSAWITMKSGDSRIIRGMRVYLIGPEVRNSSDLWGSVVDKLNSAHDLSKSLQADAGVGADMQAAAATDRQHEETLLQQISAMKSQDRLPTQNAYQVIRNACVLSAGMMETSGELVTKDGAWAQLVANSCLDNGYTDASGNFEVKGAISDGSFIYASYSTSVEVIEWLVPIQSAQNGEVKIDLFNENVSRTFSSQKSDP